MANLTYKSLNTWKGKVDNSIRKNLVASLNRIATYSNSLKTITKSADDGELSLNYRFNDLNKLSTEASKKLSTCLNKFDESMTSYLNTVKRSEENAAAEMKKKIDQFREVANKISKISM